MISDVRSLAAALEACGCHCIPMDRHIGYFVHGQGIKGRFCELGHGDGYEQHNGKIALDNIICYDKPQKCPLVMKLPLDFDALLEHITFLGSDEGYEWSNSYRYLSDPRLPCE